MRAAAITVILTALLFAAHYAGVSAMSVARALPDGPVTSDVKATIAQLSAEN